MWYFIHLFVVAAAPLYVFLCANLLIYLFVVYVRRVQDAAQLKPQFALNGRVLPPVTGAAQPGDKVPFHPTLPGVPPKASTCMQVAVGAPERANAFLSVNVDQATADNLEMQIAWIIVQ